MTVDSLAGRQSILSREALLEEHWKPVRMNDAKYSHTVLDFINKECRPRANHDLSLNIKKICYNTNSLKNSKQERGKTRIGEMAFKSKNIKALLPFSTHVLQMLEEEKKQAHTAVFARDLGQHCRA